MITFNFCVFTEKKVKSLIPQSVVSMQIHKVAYTYKTFLAIFSFDTTWDAVKLVPILDPTSAYTPFCFCEHSLKGKNSIEKCVLLWHGL